MVIYLEKTSEFKTEKTQTFQIGEDILIDILVYFSAKITREVQAG